MNSSRHSSPYRAQRKASWQRNRNTITHVSAIKLGPVTHTVLIALMVTVLGLIYLSQATRVTGYDYQAQSIDNEIATLDEQASDLEVENARLTALKSIETSSIAQAMEQPGDIDYARE